MQNIISLRGSPAGNDTFLVESGGNCLKTGALLCTGEGKKRHVKIIGLTFPSGSGWFEIDNSLSSSCPCPFHRSTSEPFLVQRTVAFLSCPARAFSTVPCCHHDVWSGLVLLSYLYTSGRPFGMPIPNQEVLVWTLTGSSNNSAWIYLGLLAPIRTILYQKQTYHTLISSICFKGQELICTQIWLIRAHTFHSMLDSSVHTNFTHLYTKVWGGVGVGKLG